MHRHWHYLCRRAEYHLQDITRSPLAPIPHRDTKVSIAFSIVHYTCNLGTPSLAGADPPIIKRAGLATSYMEIKRSAVALPYGGPEERFYAKQCRFPRLRIFYKPTISFRLPGSVEPPLILIGPGTGVAPFIGFLEQRRYLEAERAPMRARATMMPPWGCGVVPLSCRRKTCLWSSIMSRSSLPRYLQVRVYIFSLQEQAWTSLRGNAEWICGGQDSECWRWL